MEPENEGLEDDFPFQTCRFSGSMLIFRGVCMSGMKTYPVMSGLFYRP